MQDTSTSRRRWTRCANTALAALMLAALILFPDSAAADNDERLVIREGTDPSWAVLMRRGDIPVGRNSDGGVRGSTIHVNTALLTRRAGYDGPIPRDIRIHTLCNSFIQRDEFDRWTRWYQEDGNTQVFRLFEGEHNVRNDRPGAARIEAFSALQWQRGDGWHEWAGMYTIIQPTTASLFQVKNSDNDWGVMVRMNDDGDVYVLHRRGEPRQVSLGRRMAGRSFELGFRDNGHAYQVYFNRELVAEGTYNRPTGTTCFRWGMYTGTVQNDAMVLVTGARFQRQPRATEEQ